MASQFRNGEKVPVQRLHCCWLCSSVGLGSLKNSGWLKNSTGCVQELKYHHRFFLRQSCLPLHLRHNGPQTVHLVQTLRNQVQPPGGSDSLRFAYQSQDKPVKLNSILELQRASRRSPASAPYGNPPSAEWDNSGFIHTQSITSSEYIRLLLKKLERNKNKYIVRLLIKLSCSWK